MGHLLVTVKYFKETQDSNFICSKIWPGIRTIGGRGGRIMGGLGATFKVKKWQIG